MLKREENGLLLEGMATICHTRGTLAWTRDSFISSSIVLWSGVHIPN